MKRYTLSFADSIRHVPDHPERTACRHSSWDVYYQVWTSRAAMLKTLDMQGKRASHHTDWHEWKPRHAPTAQSRRLPGMNPDILAAQIAHLSAENAKLRAALTEIRDHWANQYDHPRGRFDCMEGWERIHAWERCT